MISVYRVGKGETFVTIANKFNLSSEALKRDNGFTGEVFEGARLIIRPSKCVYKVKPFEKLSDIAHALGVTPELLMEANGLRRPYVFAGQILVMPCE